MIPAPAPAPVRRWHPHNLDRFHYTLLWQRLLSSGRRTADPAQADYFWVPVSQRQLGTRNPKVGGAKGCWQRQWCAPLHASCIPYAGACLHALACQL